MKLNRSGSSLLACLAGLVLLTAADLATKAWAEQALSRPRSTPVTAVCAPDASGSYYMQRMRADSVVLIEGYLEFRYAENCGAAFSMLDNAPRFVRVSVFMVAGTLAIVALMWMFVTGNGGKLFAWSVPLIVSGALGNMIDRVRLGYVIDFVHFHVHDAFVYPTFNFADSTITVGVAMLLLDGLRKPATAPTTNAAQT
jgi:signal peptidase II